MTNRFGHQGHLSQHIQQKVDKFLIKQMPIAKTQIHQQELSWISDEALAEKCPIASSDADPRALLIFAAQRRFVLKMFQPRGFLILRASPSAAGPFKFLAVAIWGGLVPPLWHSGGPFRHLGSMNSLTADAWTVESRTHDC